MEPTRHSLRVRQASNHRSLCDRWLLPQVALDLLALALVMLRSMKSNVSFKFLRGFLYLGAQSSLAGLPIANLHDRDTAHSRAHRDVDARISLRIDIQSEEIQHHNRRLGSNLNRTLLYWYRPPRRTETEFTHGLTSAIIRAHRNYPSPSFVKVLSTRLIRSSSIYRRLAPYRPRDRSLMQQNRPEGRMQLTMSMF